MPIMVSAPPESPCRSPWALRSISRRSRSANRQAWSSVASARAASTWATSRVRSSPARSARPTSKVTRRFTRRRAPTKASTSFASSAVRFAISSSSCARAISGLGTPRAKKTRSAMSGCAASDSPRNALAPSSEHTALTRNGSSARARTYAPGVTNRAKKAAMQAGRLLGVRGVGQRADEASRERRIVVASARSEGAMRRPRQGQEVPRQVARRRGPEAFGRRGRDRRFVLRVERRPQPVELRLRRARVGVPERGESRGDPDRTRYTSRSSESAPS